MSASLLADRSSSGSQYASSAPASIETDYLAPVVPIRRAAPVAPVRPAPAPPARRSASPVSRRAGSRGARYVRSSAPTDWQLSRRGELLLRRVTAVVAAAVLVLVVVAGAFAVARAVDPSPMQTRTVSVQPGQSLWQLAASASPGADVSDTADEIRSLNHLSGTTLTPGQVLVVPVAR